jgi:hypothetical protein
MRKFIRTRRPLYKTLTNGRRKPGKGQFPLFQTRHNTGTAAEAYLLKLLKRDAEIWRARVPVSQSIITKGDDRKRVRVDDERDDDKQPRPSLGPFDDSYSVPGLGAFR